MAKGRLRVALENWWEESGVGNRFSSYTTEKVENIEKEGINKNPDLINLVKNTMREVPVVGDDMAQSVSGEDFIGIVAVLGVLISAWVSIMLQGFSPISDAFRYALQRVVKSGRLSVSEMIQIKWRHGDEILDLLTDLADGGFEPARVDPLIETVRPRVNNQELLSLFRRKKITEESYFKEMLQRGWSRDETDSFITSSQLLPGAQDLIRFMVREVFDPQQRQSLGLDADFPADEMRDQGGKIGLTEDVAKDFWAAHWQLPSVGQTFQFRHRLRGQEGLPNFTDEDLQGLLKALDISPTFRPLLEGIAFSTLTRIDIRRAFRLNLMNKSEVEDAYRDIGYTGKNLDINVAIATSGEGETGRDLSEAVIKKAYKLRRFTRDVALAELIKRNFDENEADIILDLIDLEVEQDIVDDEVSVLTLDFVENDITEASYRSSLTALGLVNSEVEFLVSKNDLKRKRKIKKPSESMLANLYRENIISAAEYEKELDNRGWNNIRINWIRELLEIDIQQDAEKDAERARKEADRQLAKEERNEFQLAKAQRAVAIADFKVEIADLKVAANSIDDDDELAGIKEEILEIKAQIARENLSKAEITQERFENGA